MDLHLYNYNNYYNRTIKPVGNTIIVQDLTDYELYVEWNVNFNPNDGITTEHIIGGASSYEGDADYAILADGERPVSCWFVIENQRTRGGQYKVHLKRDTVGMYLNHILEAPCFVEKGWVPDTDPAIFNKENITYNQIKTSEVLLKDATKVPWLVGYYVKGNKLDATIPEIEIKADYTVNGIENWEYYQYTNQAARVPTGFDMFLYFDNTNILKPNATIYIDGLTQSSNNLQVVSTGESTGTSGRQYKIASDKIGSAGETIVGQMKAKTAQMYRAAANSFTSMISSTTYDALTSLGDRTIYDSDGKKLYKIGWERVIGDTSYYESVNADLTDFGYQMYGIYAGVDGITRQSTSPNSLNKNILLRVNRTNTIKLTLNEIAIDSYSVSIDPSASGQTTNSPFNIFAIPYGDFWVKPKDADVYSKMTADMSMRLCMDMISKYSGANAVLYDVQLLPYCPIAEVRNNMDTTSKPTIDLANILDDLYTNITSTAAAVKGVVFHCRDTSHQFTINQSIAVDNIKVSNETEFCRLVSPNWNGMFEFSPAKNYGVDYFTVDYELKPFTPYIHVAPAWNRSGLYGKRDNDPIGLICGGDFGLSMISDKWAEYERQNKNYQNIFDRQIQNLEVQNQYARMSDVIGAGVGTAQGAASGAMMGMMTGNPYIAAGAGVVGGVASGIGGVMDVNINQALRDENMDLTRDMYKYQLGNIKALPQSLARVNSLNPNNTLFPILEFYSCSDKERVALERQLVYNGMTIGRIGAIGEYINPTADYTFVKGQIIMLEQIGEDSHLAYDLAAEINKGVRI